MKRDVMSCATPVSTTLRSQVADQAPDGLDESRIAVVPFVEAERADRHALCLQGYNGKP